MFAMMASLTRAQQKSAEITSDTLDDLVMGPGHDAGNFLTPEGAPVLKLDAGQKKLVVAAITAYAGDLTTVAATQLIAKYTAELDQTMIGWSNSTDSADKNSYLRIDGPSVWIQLINIRSPGSSDSHIHTVPTRGEWAYPQQSSRPSHAP